MEKVLRKYTIIPSDLYVKRNADKQLKRIIDEMERPGYVLVARQMGKTNLLLNAKRELENERNLFAYVDLSNAFTEERDCYRNIIDSILEPNEERFENILGKIYTQRDGSILPPHKEYEKELRAILKELGGKLIIILDEVDALRTAKYSDNIFAQIRSSYFARTNFPEFNNLTYVLSGVIEPTELIKDRNKSPFNIGEKIYLDDFSFDEHKEFIRKSSLKITEDIINEVYLWTNGNPRLTFDLCSEIETHIVDGEDVTVDLVEELVKKKYLTSFDIAPIDHIRELVKENRGIREAILKLHNGENDLNDEVKKKLYLFGIISSELESENLKIKNKIIEKSLSIEWLRSLESHSKSLFEIGSDLILEKNNYLEGIQYLDSYLNSSNKISQSNKELTYYYIGFAYHNLKEYGKSNEYLNTEIISLDLSPDLHYRQKLFIGLNYLGLNQFEEGVEVLEEIVRNYKKSSPYINALLNLGVNLFYYDQKRYHDRIESLLDELLGNIDSANFDDSDNISIKEYKTLAYYYQAENFLSLGNIDKAKNRIQLALQEADKKYLPETLFFQFRVKEQGGEDRIVILQRIVREIIESKLGFDESYKYPIAFNETLNLKYLENLVKLNQENLYNELSAYTKEQLYKDKFSNEELTFRIASFVEDKDVAKKLYLNIVNGTENQELIFRSFKSLTLLSFPKDRGFEDFFQAYLNHFSVSKEPIETADISAFAYGIKHYVEKSKLDKALKISKLIEKRLEEIDEELEFESIIIYYWLTHIYFNLRLRTDALFYSDKTLDLISKNERKSASIIDEEGISIIKKNVLDVKNYFIKRIPLKSDKEFSRNDRVKVRYSDGKIIERKYKQVEQDILSGKCDVISKV